MTNSRQAKKGTGMWMTRRTILLSLIGFVAAAEGKVEFRLEIPEANTTIRQNQVGRIPHPFISRLRVWIDDRDRRVDYGKIFVRVNGESANIIMTTRAQKKGIFCDLDLMFRAGFQLYEGRNSVEIKAEDRFERSFLGSFVLLVDSRYGSSKALRTETQVMDRGSPLPQLYLVSPSGPLSDLEEKAFFEGFIVHGSADVGLTLAGKPAPIEPVRTVRSSQGTRQPGSEFRFRFRQQVQIEAGSDEILATVQDGGGNRTSVIVPILPFQQSRPEEKYAVVVGVSDYEMPGLDLRYAHADATAFTRFLIEDAGFRPSHVLTLRDEDATGHEIRTALFTFLAQADVNDQVVIYLAGHGVRDKHNPLNHFFLPHDADLDNLGATAIPMWQLRDLFQRVLATRNVVTFVDACHSAALSDQWQNLVHQYVAKAASVDGRAVIAASDIGQYAQEADGHGVFTYYLLEGLRGEADADADGEITGSELFEYVGYQVSRSTSGSQTPVFLAGMGRQEPLFPRLAKPKTRRAR